MGHTNSTTNYSLPQFITTDKPAWLTDINGAFSAIDSGLHTAQTDATTAKNTADSAQSDATAAGTAASTAGTKADGAIASIADAFDTTATYAVGDLVMYNSLLYICSVAVTTPGAWTGTTNWTRTTVESQIPLNAGELPLGSSTPAGSTAKAIADLDTKTSVTADTLTAASAAVSITRGNFWKMDKMIFVCGNFTSSGAFSSGVSIMNLPSGINVPSAYDAAVYSETGTCYRVYAYQDKIVANSTFPAGTYAFNFCAKIS